MALRDAGVDPVAAAGLAVEWGRHAAAAEVGASSELERGACVLAMLHGLLWGLELGTPPLEVSA